ncbi:hypothetical protein ATC00_12150 [Sinorhizobium americanum]|nr:hypothetical protein ATC00_12150 [Sinorhizobium americanum]
MSGNCDVENFNVEFHGSGNRLLIERSCRLNTKFVFKGNDNTIHIGHHCQFIEAVIQAEYGTRVQIGPMGMFARGLIVRSGDSHSVIDIATLKRVNFSKSVLIAPRVWAGYDVSIMKGVTIHSDTIIGAASVVTKTPDEGRCILAGIPAKIVRRGVFWDKRSLGDDVPEQFWIDSLNERGIDRNDYLIPEDCAIETEKRT